MLYQSEYMGLNRGSRSKNVELTDMKTENCLKNRDRHFDEELTASGNTLKYT